MHKWMNKLLAAVLLTTSLVALPTVSVYSAKPDISKIQIDTRQASNAKDLARRSPLIVLGWCDTAYEEVPTSLLVEGRRVVKFTQKLHIKQVLKGKSPKLLTLLSEGVNPLPDPSSPLNKHYPGPLAEGDYLVFLQPIPGTDMYSLVGLWQGVYPMLGGKTVSLEGIGFPQLNQLSAPALVKKIKELEQQP